MFRIRTTSSAVALLVAQFAVIGCGAGSDTGLSDTATDDSEGASSRAVEDTATPAATPKLLIAPQMVEIEPGHTVTIWRYEDGTTALAEVGEIGKHEERLGETTATLPLTAMVRELAPEQPIEQLLSVVPEQDIPALGALEREAPTTKSMWAGRDNAKSTDDATVTGTLPASYNTYDQLHCSGAVTGAAVDVPVSTCRYSTGTLSTPEETAGYFRTRALHQGTSGSARFSLYTYAWPNTWYPTASVQLQPKQWGQMFYLSARKDRIYSSIRANAGQAVAISSHAFEVAPRAQENPHWCWLASAQMSMAAAGVNREQCNMADLHWPTQGECCRLWPQNSNYVEGDPAHDGAGESCQALAENGMSFTNLNQADLNNPLALAQALQNGPVIVHQPAGPHYTVLSDYREVFVNGAWVPYALRSDPSPQRNYSTATHMSWVRLDRVGLGHPNGYGDFALADIRSQSTGLNAKIRRVSWKNGVATAHFYARDAQTYEYQFLDSGGASGDGAIWRQGTVNAPTHGSPENCWKTYNAQTSQATLNVGGWLWYAVKVRACANGACGPWDYVRSVSRVPITTINSISSFVGNLTINVSANPAPAETVFRYRVLDKNTSNVIRSGSVSGSSARFSKSASIPVSAPSGVWTKVQVQACSQNGCSPWVQQDHYSGGAIVK